MQRVIYRSWEDVEREIECDSFKHEVHPVTGQLTLFFFTMYNGQRILHHAAAGAKEFTVQL